MGGVTRNWSRLLADVAVSELLQLLTHAGCHGGLRLRLTPLSRRSPGPFTLSLDVHREVGD